MNTDRIRLLYSTATGWAMPGAYVREKPKREARLSAVRSRQEAEFDSWLAEHDRLVENRGYYRGVIDEREATRTPAQLATWREGLALIDHQLAVHNGVATSMDSGRES